MIGQLNIILIKGQLIRNLNFFGAMDVFIKLIFDDQTITSQVHESGGLTPIWNQQFTLDIKHQYCCLVEVYNMASFEDELIGSGTLNLKSIENKPQQQIICQQMIEFKKKPAGIISLSIQYQPDVNTIQKLKQEWNAKWKKKLTIYQLHANLQILVDNVKINLTQQVLCQDNIISSEILQEPSNTPNWQKTLLCLLNQEEKIEIQIYNQRNLVGQCQFMLSQLQNISGMQQIIIKNEGKNVGDLFFEYEYMDIISSQEKKQIEDNKRIAFEQQMKLQIENMIKDEMKRKFQEIQNQQKQQQIQKQQELEQKQQQLKLLNEDQQKKQIIEKQEQKKSTLEYLLEQREVTKNKNVIQFIDIYTQSQTLKKRHKPYKLHYLQKNNIEQLALQQKIYQVKIGQTNTQIDNASSQTQRYSTNKNRSLQQEKAINSSLDLANQEKQKQQSPDYKQRSYSKDQQKNENISQSNQIDKNCNDNNLTNVLPKILTQTPKKLSKQLKGPSFGLGQKQTVESYIIKNAQSIPGPGYYDAYSLNQEKIKKIYNFCSFGAGRDAYEKVLSPSNNFSYSCDNSIHNSSSQEIQLKKYNSQITQTEPNNDQKDILLNITPKKQQLPSLKQILQQKYYTPNKRYANSELDKLNYSINY